MNKKEYRIFLLGVVVLGGFFGTIIFYNAPEIWMPAPGWSILSSLVASLLLAPIIIFSYRPKTGFKPRIFLALLVLCGALVMWIDAAYNVPGPIGNSDSGVASLLINIQTTSSWAYRLFILIPIIFTVFALWVCGMFSLSLARGVTKAKKDSPNYSLITLSISSVGVVLLVIMTIASVMFIKSGPVYVLYANELNFPKYKWDEKVLQLKEDILTRSDDVKSIEVYQGYVDVEHTLAKSIFEKYVLLELTQQKRLRRGKLRASLIHGLKRYESSLISIYDDPDRPAVPSEETYTFVENNFVLDQKVLSKLGIDTAELPDDAAAKLRMSSEKSLPEITIDIANLTIPLTAIGSIEKVQTEYQEADLPTPRWELFSLIQKDSPTGVLVSLNEHYIRSFGLSLSAIETTIMEYIGAQTLPIDIRSFEEIVLASSDNGQKIRLRDIARVDRSELNDRYRTINGRFYDIRLQ
ncbi:MAG: hypothetical protein ACRBF0_18875 [Calditrichia bacterium]